MSARLIAQDRHDEARDFFVKYHANGDESHPLVALQMGEALDALHGQPLPTWKDLFDLRVLFESRASRYRIMLNMTFAWFGQFSGNKYASSSREGQNIANTPPASSRTTSPSCSSTSASPTRTSSSSSTSSTPSPAGSSPRRAPACTTRSAAARCSSARRSAWSSVLPSSRVLQRVSSNMTIRRRRPYASSSSSSSVPSSRRDTRPCSPSTRPRW